jgi:hypothetical protein
LGIGVGQGFGAGIGLGIVILADATVANAVNMATATTTFMIFCAFIDIPPGGLEFLLYLRAIPMPMSTVLIEYNRCTFQPLKTTCI